MTCADVRQQLLASERPDHPGPDESRHLANCPACHAWLRRLVRLERQIPHLVVPASAAPVALLDRIQGEAVPPLVRVPAPPHTQRERVREFGRQKLALACSLAASLALFALAWWAWPPVPGDSGREVPVKGSYALQRDTRLLQSRTAKERVWALTVWAEDILADARGYGDDPAKMQELARNFDRLVREDLLQDAEQLPASERAGLLGPVARRFGDTESKAEHLAAAWEKNHPTSARALRQIAKSAAEADKRLRELGRG